MHSKGNSPSDAAAWAQQNFGQLSLGDPRRNRRALTISQALAERPGMSIPQLFDSEYDRVAAYDFFDRPEVTPDSVQACHRQQTIEALGNCSCALLISDLTTMSWTGKKPIPGLGPIGTANKRAQGFIMHSMLAVDWSQPSTTTRRHPVSILGLVDQAYIVRDQKVRRRAKEPRPERRKRWRESLLWHEAVARVGPVTGTRLIHVSDRESDNFEFIQECRRQNHGFTIRACRDRALVEEHSGRKLFELARSQASLGEVVLDVPARPGQPARQACLYLSACEASIRPPYRPGGRSKERCRVTVVRVWEPEGELEWILLTDTQVTDLAGAIEVMGQYRARWLIEEYFKAIKTGLKAEDLQLETGHRLMAAVGMMSVVALRLVSLKEHLRLEPKAPAEKAGCSAEELRVLSKVTGRELETVEDVGYAVASLGGHMKRNGPPGWQTLWRGMSRLRDIMQGYRISHPPG